MVNVKGRWVLITGTARGIGHLTAKLMTSRGANLILHGRTTEHCAKDYFKTPLGGPYAPNAPESAIPGIAVGAFVDDKKSGRYLNAPYFAGLTLEEAVTKAESEFGSPYAR